MTFNSFTFVFFFLLVIGVSRGLSSWSGRKGFLLLASYLFYALWNPPFVLLLWLSTVVDWHAAKAMHAATNKAKRRALLFLSLGVNLGMLGFFKYGNFALDNFVALAQSLGFDYTPQPLDILLPVGISFYTFQTLSYTIDVYRGRMAPWHSFLDFALYVTFFPQLVAGPIVRATDFLPQCSEPRRASWQQIGWGSALLMVGLFQKVVVADQFMAPIANKVYSTELGLGLLQAWAGTLAFAIQIFNDFAGYSACAIGVALCLGFELPDNFRSPYGAIGFSDFWRRWHISLSTWLRDYLYIPLGGNRKGGTRTLVNLSATMLLGGLWHGASWLFVIWGGLHGAYLMAERVVVASPLARLGVWSTWGGKAALSLGTFGLVCFSWVFFRARELDTAFAITGSMLGLNGLASGLWLSPVEFLTVAAATAATLGYHFLARETTLEGVVAAMPWWTRSAALGVMAYVVLISLIGEDNAFIYFQF